MTEKKEKNQSQENQKNNQIKCECGSAFGYLRLKTKQWICRKCGKIKEIK